MNFVDFNLRTMKKFDVLDEVRKIIYDHRGEKFIYNGFTKKMQLSPIWLSKIN